VLDATDLGSIQKMGQWRNPDLKPEGGLTFSTHDLNVRDGKVYLAHYHGGVVVLGVRTLVEASNPPLLAWLLPTGTKYTSSSAPQTWASTPSSSTRAWTRESTRPRGRRAWRRADVMVSTGRPRSSSTAGW
jgi:hypothetical protein